MPSLVARRKLVALLSAAIILLGPAAGQAQEADEGGENVLVLGYECGSRYGDTPSLSGCLQRQNDKADRWLQLVVESYARWAAKETEVRKQYGGSSIDLVAQLRESQTVFDTYRKDSAELVRQSCDGMGCGLESAVANFKLTIDRVRFLLDACYSRFNSKPANKVDLT